jgi:hypothetical protein
MKYTDYYTHLNEIAFADKPDGDAAFYADIDKKLKSKEAKHMKTDGTVILVKPKNGKKFELDELREYVGGYIEVKKMGKWWMVLNEEGHMLGLQVNPIATGMYHAIFGNVNHAIVGNVLFCRIDQID